MNLLPLFEYIMKTDLKGRNLLYHSTAVHYALGILDSNVIMGASSQMINHKYSSKNRYYNPDIGDFGEYDGVSLTRNYRFTYDMTVQFILDGDLIKRDYGKKLMPFDYFNDTSKQKFQRDESLNEYEEFLLGDLGPLNKYLLGIRILDYQDFLKNVNDRKLITFNSIVEKLGIRVYDEKFNDITDQLKSEIGKERGDSTETLFNPNG